MNSDDESIVLLQRWKAGDEEAAKEIFARYMNRLAGLARSRLSEKLQRRVDEDDVVQSVYRTFFRHAKADRYELRRSGDLWALLASITIKKVLGQVEYHQAEKRTIDLERDLPDSSGSVQLAPASLAREPTMEEAIALADEVERFMSKIDSVERKILELRLQEKSTVEIAETAEVSPRTVRRVLERLKAALAQRLDAVETS